MNISDRMTVSANLLNLRDDIDKLGYLTEAKRPEVIKSAKSKILKIHNILEKYHDSNN